MAPKASEEGSPARSALEKSLTLNKKQSWFGSIRSAVHQSALSAKAAVESLRGGSNTRTSLVDTDTPCNNTDTPSTQHTHGNQTVRNTPSTTKSAVASLRRHLSIRSRNSDRGSVSSVFRRTGSNASSLRGPETHVCHSRDLSKRMSRLSMAPDVQEDGIGSASSIPLPSSPIDIPAPRLKLDFGPPASISSFEGTTGTALDKIKVLQDPRSITAGCPSSNHLAWSLENTRPCPLPRKPVVSGTSLLGAESKHASAEPEQFSVAPIGKREDRFSRTCSPITLPGLSLQSQPNATKHASPKRSMSKSSQGRQGASVRVGADYSPVSAKSRGLNTKSPFSLEVRNPDGVEDFAGVPMSAMSGVGTTSARLPVSCAEHSIAAEEEEEEEEQSSSIEPLELPPPRFSLEVQEGKDVNDNINIDHASRGKTKVGGPNAPELDVDCTQRPLVAPTVSGLSSLIAGAAQKSRQDTPVEELAIAGLSHKGSPSHKDADTTGEFKVWSTSSAIDVASVQDPSKTRESSCLRRDSLFADFMNEVIPQHGPPSPTRKVQLPLRLKNELTKRNSYESMVFKPNLDRAAAKQLGVFRPGSDPTLRQRYFPHLPVSPSTLARQARQSSLDSDEGGTPSTQNSSEHSNIFERAVEAPSPLQIRKQSGYTVTDFASLPGTPTEGADPAHAPDSSSPTRTPSMGDRQLFDLQRAERNARYNAIHSGGGDEKGGDSDLQPANFENAGPGSTGSSPKRSSSGEASDIKEAERLLEQTLAALPALEACPGSRSAKGRVVFTLSRD